ncbi:MAG: type II secretion system protein [Candidatus Paceibacterota bacterium]
MKMISKKSGFTIIESMIYIGIASGVLVVLFSFAWQIVYGGVKAQSIREVQQNSRLAMERIAESVLNAKDITVPASRGNNGTTLSLTMYDPSLSPTVISLSSGKVVITQGGEGPYEITNDRVEVTNLRFTNVSYSTARETVRVQMTIIYKNQSKFSYYDASMQTEGTFSLRK